MTATIAPNYRRLTATEVTKTYGSGSDSVCALAPTSVSIERGERVVLAGRSGSGKSTLIKVLGLLTSPTTGTVQADDTELTDLNELEQAQFRAGAVGIVFQSFNLLPHLSARQNVALPSVLRGDDSMDHAAQLLEEVQLGDRMDRRPDQLSGGEQQRVALARSLCNRPAFILADEPTGNLDFDTEVVILQLLSKAAAGGCGVVVASHSSEVSAWADRRLDLGSVTA